MAVQLGKRYKDEETGIEVLCIKPGDGALAIDDRALELMQPKVLPSADLACRALTARAAGARWRHSSRVVSYGAGSSDQQTAG